MTNRWDSRWSWERPLARRDLLRTGGAALVGRLLGPGRASYGALPQNGFPTSPDAPPPDRASIAGTTLQVALPPPRSPHSLLLDSPFGINTGFFEPTTPRLNERLALMQAAGIKWGRQDYIWEHIEQKKGEYDWKWNDQVADQCLKHGVLLFGNLAYNPPFHDPRTPEGVKAYCAFARVAVTRHQGKVDYWQIWNEPNGGFWKGTPEEYARLLAESGRAIHEANPRAKILGLNMAFADVLWAEKILRLIPYDCFDIVDYHPYRDPSAPEDQFDWWEADQYVKVWHKDDLRADYPLIRMNMLEQASELTKVMEKFGKAKPLWICEICWNAQLGSYGRSELSQAELLARCYLLMIASGKIAKVFWYVLVDEGTRETNGGDMMGLARADLTPRYAFYAYASMTRMLEGAHWIRNDAWGPEVFVAVFTDEYTQEDIIAAWTIRPYSYIQVNNEEGLTIFDLFGKRRLVPSDSAKAKTLTVPLGPSPIYIVGRQGLKGTVRPDPGA
jgi:hypothetical protein